MKHYAQPPPVVLDIITTDHQAIRSLIEAHESHRGPTFCPIARGRMRVTFPDGFDEDNEVVLRQLVAELQNIGQTNVKIER